ncbi:hypothetical protein [Neorhizobium sp. LjRoot104]|uniref:hypothetical protein n=1 Tax=Neorhizobium sp. LjRoot104 TaxID=3342254 RepID=UPI003ECF04D7
MTDDEKKHVYTAFGSPEAASEFTGGKIYDVKGYEGHAFILTDKDGNNFVYVTPESTKYRDLANDVAGERISQTKDDADHAASRTIADQRGGRYVLLARVPARANRSAGRVEKLDTLDGNFNYAAAKRTGGGDIGLTMTHRQSQKLLGRKVDEYDRTPLSTDELGSDPDMQRALFQSPENQRNIESMKGALIASHDLEQKHDHGKTTAVATGIKGPWDRHRAESSKVPESPRPPGPRK